MSIDPLAAERAARAALLGVAEPGHPQLCALVERWGPVEALDRLCSPTRPAELARLRVLDVAAVTASVATMWEVAERCGARLVIPEDREWPAAVFEGLRWLGTDVQPSMPPLALWLRGNGTLAEACVRSVAVVGARAASAYGVHVATELGFGLAERGWTVVSGGAHGIDGAAHRGALHASGRTVAVLACGVDRPYPTGHHALFERIVADGLLVSEWPPGATPQRFRFLIRNRVIAAMSRGTVVVEAAARSGARQTARVAAELSRPVLAMPGAVTSAMSVGTHALIRDDHATLATGPADVIEALSSAQERASTSSASGARPAGDAAVVLGAIDGQGMLPAAQIAQRAGLGLVVTLRVLSRLVADGWVRSEGSSYGAAPPGALVPDR